MLKPVFIECGWAPGIAVIVPPDGKFWLKIHSVDDVGAEVITPMALHVRPTGAHITKPTEVKTGFRAQA